MRVPIRLALPFIVISQLLIVAFCIPVFSDASDEIRQEQWPIRYKASMAPYQFPENKKDDYEEYWREYYLRFREILEKVLMELGEELKGEKELEALVEKLQKSIEADIWTDQDRYDEKPISKWWEEGLLLHSNHFMWSEFTLHNVRTHIYYDPHHQEVLLFLKNFNHEENTAVRRLDDTHTFMIYNVLAHTICFHKPNPKENCPKDKFHLAKTLLGIARDYKVNILNREDHNLEKTKDDEKYLNGMKRVFAKNEELYLDIFGYK